MEMSSGDLGIVARGLDYFPIGFTIFSAEGFVVGSAAYGNDNPLYDAWASSGNQIERPP